ncbi:MAG: PorT family protein [Prolixibacteraceae bacterium]|nr:PorT family protein [Prolixibacteraceae bacterium]MBN2774368.1 PorT family protein [Prolixibacteraceae bacterium]
MKKFVLAIFLIILVITGFAQRTKVNYLTTFDDKRLHFGFTLGINTLDFGVQHFTPIGENPEFFPTVWPGDQIQVGSYDTVRADVSRNVAGFTVGIITSLRLTRDFNLRFLPGLSFGERRLIYNVPVIDVNEIYTSNNYEYSIKSTFLDFPLLIKYKALRINNNRPYVIFGIAYRQDISKTAKEDLVRLKKGGFYAEMGAGWDTYMLFFRFSMEAKVSIGLNNQLGAAPVEQRQYYTHSINRLTSNIFTLSFHFE